VLIETLCDNIGSKMNALVDRGSPRDLMDVKRVVDARLLDTAQCWELWLKKNPGATPHAGKQKVLLHLASLEARRPLDAIADPADRERARRLREWYRHEFLV
jgi:hypothetical protein